MVKLVLTDGWPSYSEIPQVNPLRWKIMLRDGDTYTDQSGWIRCKDFFNDVVAWFKEQSAFSMYRFKNDVKKNEEGVYFLLNHIKDFPQFCGNIEVLNKQLVKGKQETLRVVAGAPAKQAIVLIPNSLWQSTYLISLVTMCIRLSNYGVAYESWEDFWKEGSPAKGVDSAFDSDSINFVLKYGFKLPLKYRKYWFYAGPTYNSKERPELTGTIIHGNGVCSWVNWINMVEED